MNLTEKYKKVLPFTNAPRNGYKKMSLVLETNVKILNKYFLYKTQDEKIAASYVIKELFLKKKNFDVKNIKSYIDEFFNHYHNNYNKYINSLVIEESRFNSKICFLNDFVNKFII